MKSGNYTVRGTIGPAKSEPVTVRVGPFTSDPALMAFYSDSSRGVHGAWFTYRGVDYVFKPRPLSPHPERIRPAKVKLDEQATPKSIAAAAFKAAKEAAEREADIVRREAEQDGVGLDDIALLGVASRSMGVAQ